jgi:uncharacterized protein (TIGR00299 family) protein
MKTAYLDCASGISGDMTLGALIDAGANLEAINAAIGSLGWSNVRVTTTPVKKKGFRATQVKIEHEPEHKHRHLHHITAMIDGSLLNARQRELAHRIFLKLAQAEAKVHGSTIEKVHFHEVGAVDSICDIVGVAVAWDLLGIQRAVASAIPTGTGFIEIAHGRCSIPAPATAELLTGIPLAPSNVPYELTTPTGAAILAALVESYGPVPAIKVETIGYGSGERDLEEQANLLRLLVGESSGQAATETLVLLETNLDDVSGELIGHAIGRLWEAGALDVYTTAIQMKKNRPGVMLSVLCEPTVADVLEAILFRETTTLGVRRLQVERHKLSREKKSVDTRFGQIDGVLARLEDGTSRFSPEYESCRLAAERHRVALREVYEMAQRAAAD